MRIPSVAIILACAASSLFGGEFRVGVLNCDHLSSPLLERPGSPSAPLSLQEYQVKLDNLGRLVTSSSLDSIGLLGVSGKEEVASLGERIGMSGFWQSTKNERTGDGLAYFYRLKEGYKIENLGRIWALRSIDEHLVVQYSPLKKGDGHNIFVLVTRLSLSLKSDEKNKHAKELLAVKNWSEKICHKDKNAIVLILGETGKGEGSPNLNVLNFSCEPNASLVVAGAAKWKLGATLEPVQDKYCLGEKKRIFTEHYLVSGQIEY